MSRKRASLKPSRTLCLLRTWKEHAEAEVGARARRDGDKAEERKTREAITKRWPAEVNGWWSRRPYRANARRPRPDKRSTTTSQPLSPSFCTLQVCRCGNKAAIRDAGSGREGKAWWAAVAGLGSLGAGAAAGDSKTGRSLPSPSPAPYCGVHGVQTVAPWGSRTGDCGIGAHDVGLQLEIGNGLESRQSGNLQAVDTSTPRHRIILIAFSSGTANGLDGRPDRPLSSKILG
ncbi:hypothetical protein F4780DRAFT_224396 [Xylariomycetidae sp. FL0641]|nr:hypothetical protein F4780DRAFT_224396 [Xylariomycetidae sp. FL0641]